MEISGRVLREVEFRDRLRGYDTEEVDDFLEKVAVALDALMSELESLRSSGGGPERDPVDDESLRRTLVLAQRTADLAIKEARDEAAGMLEDARTQAEALVGGARDEAKRLREGAEAEAGAKIAELDTRRTELEGEVASLAAFVESERRRFIAGLSQALDVVSSSLEGPPLREAAASAPPRRPEREEGAGPPTQLVTALVAEDEGDRATGEGEAPTGEPAVVETPGAGLSLETEPGADHAEEVGLGQSPEAAIAEVESAVDPDEELWQRWAKGGELDSESSERGRVMRSSQAGRSERRGGA